MILVFDFGSQTTHLISRRVRDLGVYSEMVSYKTKASQLRKRKDVEGIILSGGPAAAYIPDSLTVDKQVFELGVPVLGICYGMQLMGQLLGGRVKLGKDKVRSQQSVWMSHGDQVIKLPTDFKAGGRSRYAKHIAMADEKRDLYGVQFHPEVEHTDKGQMMLKNFVIDICQAKKTWSRGEWLKQEIEKIKNEVGEDKLICGLSGGVDSSTAARMVYKAVGKQLRCVYVDTGLMRLGETEQVEKDFKKLFGKNLVVIKAENQFLKRLRGVIDPEEKRRRIGELFIRLFEKEAKKWGGVKWLVQGTIYPDVIESAKKHDTAEVIKTHHNVGGLPAKMELGLVEPLRDLYKDEVRQIAKKLGLPESVRWRQPFPGPGLGIRIRGEVTKERLERLRQAEAILQEEMGKIMKPKETWQTFVVYVPLETTGVKADERSFEEMIAIRSLTSSDAMTADWTRLPYDLLAKVSTRIVNEVTGINRVVYDITTKPPATMEWE